MILVLQPLRPLATREGSEEAHNRGVGDGADSSGAWRGEAPREGIWLPGQRQQTLSGEGVAQDLMKCHWV